MIEQKRPVIVMGHKNPDTDSICAAITYANLKRQITGDDYIACRAGHLNEETQFVMSYFKVETPAYVKDVRTQVRDMEIRMKRPFRGCLSRKTFLRFRKILLKRRFPVIAQDEDLYVQIGFGIPWVIRYEELGLE